MTLSTLEQVRLGVGDIKEPYILTDEQIFHYLTVNNDDVNATITELQPIVLQILSANSYSIKTEDLWEDRTKQAEAYIKGIEQGKSISASVSAFPIIGGGAYKGNTMDQFDDENNWELTDSSDFYNGSEDV